MIGAMTAESVIRAAEALAACEHESGCLAQCRCGAVEQRNEKRAEFFRLLRAWRAAGAGRYGDAGGGGGER